MTLLACPWCGGALRRVPVVGYPMLVCWSGPPHAPELRRRVRSAMALAMLRAGMRPNQAGAVLGNMGEPDRPLAESTVLTLASDGRRHEQLEAMCRQVHGVDATVLGYHGTNVCEEPFVFDGPEHGCPAARGLVRQYGRRWRRP